MAGSIDYRLRYPGTQPELLYTPYVSSRKRAPTKPLIEIPHTISEITGPIFCAADISEGACDLTKQSAGAPIGERIVVSGRVMDAVCPIFVSHALYCKSFLLHSGLWCLARAKGTF